MGVFNLTFSTSAAAQTANQVLQYISGVNQFEIVRFAVFAGAMSFAIMSAFWMIRERAKVAEKYRKLTRSHADIKVRQERNQALLDAPDQRVVLWSADGADPEIFGALPPATGAPQNPSKFIAFGTWLDAGSANVFDKAVAQLRKNAESFDLTLTTQKDRVVEVQGRTTGAHAFVRFFPLTGEREALANLEAEHGRLLNTFDTVQSLFEALSMPVWLRDSRGRLVWANSAYAFAVDVENGAVAVEQNISLLDAKERHAVRAAHAQNEIFRSRVPAIVSGDRRMLDVVDVWREKGSAGIATDMNEIERAQSKLKKIVESHARTLDQLATAVAIFDSSRHLTFYNAAFQNLWDLDAAFLDTEPEHSELLIQLRTAGKLPEQPEWRKWKDELFEVYQAVEPVEHWWHLPDGRTIRVIANPHSHDGVTWVFENVTEQLELESRYNALIQVQRETLDHLSEAVAVFAPDGTLRLSNPAFQSLWKLDPSLCQEGTRISAIAEICAKQTDDPDVWGSLQTTVTGLAEERGSIVGRIIIRSERFVDYSLMPLPNGQSMITFVDVSASVSVENALVDRNEALEQADNLKNAFVEHVSYELRSPLTNIIGFSELLGTPELGKLNIKQSEYLDHINTSSASLLAIINNILDLATVDAGIMELELAEVDLKATVEAAQEGVKERMQERGITLKLEFNQPEGRFIGDKNRIKQILFNLLSNAVTHSADGGEISLICDGDQESITMTVSDNGNGIADDIRDSVFDRFESFPNSRGRGGTGLGLAIVKSFVELHGGTTDLTSKKGHGTKVVCHFPRKPDAVSKAAE